MEPEIQIAGQGIRLETPESPITQDLMPRRFRNWIVSDRELSSLGFLSAIQTMLITFFGIASGAALSLWITLKTVSIPDVGTHSNYFAAFLVATCFTIILGIASVIALVSTFFQVSKIKKESEQEQRRRSLLSQ